MSDLLTSTATAPFREALVDLDAVRANTERFAAIVPGRLVADLGADAFGHGAAACAATVIAAGARAVVVSRVSEALALRGAGVTVPVACGMPDSDGELADAVAADLVVVATTRAQVSEARVSGVRRLALAVETGYGLPGIPVDDLPADVDGPIWIMATVPAQQQSSALDREACARLEAALERLRSTGVDVAEVVVSGPAESASELDRSVPSATGFCVGAELFGVSDSDARVPDGSRTAMTLWAPVVAVKRAGGGEGVSYGHVYRTSGSTTLVLVTLGYGDGVDRAAGNAAPVWLNGRRFTLAGRMAMDAHVIDVGSDISPVVGDPAVLFGDPRMGYPSVAEWAGLLGTTSAEVTTRLTSRVRRTHR